MKKRLDDCYLVPFEKGVPRNLTDRRHKFTREEASAAGKKYKIATDEERRKHCKHVPVPNRELEKVWMK